jgi:DEP domain-containing protein 5
MEPFLREKGSRPQTASSSVSKSTDAVERKCTIWIHDEQFSKEEVVLNLDLFPRGSVKAGDIMAIIALKADVTARDFQDKSPAPKKVADSLPASLPLDPSMVHRKSSDSTSVDGQHDVDLGRRYLFAVKEMSADLKTKSPSLEVSITKHIAEIFGFKRHSNVLLTTVRVLCHPSSFCRLIHEIGKYGNDDGIPC